MPVRTLYEALPECVLAGPADAADRLVAGVTHDSRIVGPGDLFCAVPGHLVDGHDHIDEALTRGATAVLSERPVDLEVAQLVVPHTRTAMGPVASTFHGHPSGAMAVVGVTGTNGKTTVVHVLDALLRSLGGNPAVIGTLTGSRTTPEAPELQAQLAEFRDAGHDAVAMEVSSHALAQHRTGGTEFALAIFTNLSQDHLDFHQSMEEYFEAKAALFDPRTCARALVGIDDPWGRRLADRLGECSTFSLDDVADPVFGPDGTSFTWRGASVRTRLIGRYNLANVIAAAEAAVLLGHDPGAVASAVGAAGPVPGRLEPVGAGHDFLVVVDYAHTPDALRAVLDAANDLGPGRTTVVFGCGGDRDRGKRPLMGAVAASSADRIVVTSDNPRSEDPDTIIEEIVGGAPDGSGLEIEPDRRRAIAEAVGGARPGDVVVIAGRGHETEQVGRDGPVPFDDRVVAAEALEGLR
jgi:UDP-N-acetylmuramoyl-L-alanyl-D-glutamate--2,6-diaminopimelate ligase